MRGGTLASLVWLLPAGSLKNALLRRCGAVVGQGVVVGPCLVRGVDAVELGDGVRIRGGNVLRGLVLLRMGPAATLGSWNWVSAVHGFRSCDPGAGRLVVGDGAAITSRHYLDCSGGVELGTFALLAGHRSTVLTHEIDLGTNDQTCAPVVVGARTFVSTGCVLLAGAVLPARSLLAAGSTATRVRGVPEPGMWAGTPARWVRDVDGAWFDRTEPSTDTLRAARPGPPVESPVPVPR